MVDVTPAIPEGRQLVERYGNGGFRVSGTDWTGSILVLPDRTLPWPVADIHAIEAETLAPILGGEAPPEILLIGCGQTMSLLPRETRQAIRDAGAAVDIMATGAACRTFNVLVAEQRRVAAALIAV